MASDMTAAEHAAVDAAASDSELDAAESASEAPSQEADAEASALAVLAKARAARLAEPSDDDDAPREEAAAEEAGAESGEPPVAPAEPAAAPDNKAEEVLRRLNAAEARARETEAKLKDAEARIRRAAEWEEAAKAAENGDASKVFSRLNWTVDTVAKYLEGGADALKPTIAETKADAAKSEVAELRAELARRDQQAAIERYKSDLSSRSADIIKDSPYLAQFHTGDDGKVNTRELAEAVWAVQVQLLQAGEEISEADAVKRLEAAHAKTAKRYGTQLGAKPASKAPVADAAATKPATGSTQRADTAPKKPRAPLSRDPREAQRQREAEAEADALASLRSHFKAAKLAPVED